MSKTRKGKQRKRCQICGRRSEDTLCSKCANALIRSTETLEENKYYDIHEYIKNEWESEKKKPRY